MQPHPSDSRTIDAPAARPARPTTATLPAVGRPMIQVRDLWKVFGPRAQRVPRDEHLRAMSRRDLIEKAGCTAAVREASFDVATGEVFVIMGLSGSGKSTLIRCLTRLIEPTAGSVTFEGIDLLGVSEKKLRDYRRRKFSMVFQHFGLLPHRTVLDNVAYGLQIRGVDASARGARAGEVVELVGLAGYERSYPHELSGGMQQRVGLARALAGDPDMLLFDEPFSALDPLIRRDMQAEVVRLHEQMGKTMLFVTHDLSEALKIGDRILIMRDGAMTQIGTGDELVGAPADEYVRDFVQEVPKESVLTLRWVATRPEPGEDMNGPVLDQNTVIRDAVRPVVESRARTRVVDGDRLVGMVGDAELLQVLQPRAPEAVAV